MSDNADHQIESSAVSANRENEQESEARYGQDLLPQTKHPRQKVSQVHLFSLFIIIVLPCLISLSLSL